ncbi:MAG: hypothetical protein Q7U14_02490, partial [Lacisediminimonas sp.]|nr:hypothetical protein [Lacisediminimonas sp.]
RSLPECGLKMCALRGAEKSVDDERFGTPRGRRLHQRFKGGIGTGDSKKHNNLKTDKHNNLKTNKHNNLNIAILNNLKTPQKHPHGNAFREPCYLIGTLASLAGRGSHGDPKQPIESPAP